MCLGGGLHTVMLLDTCALFLLKKLARLVAVAHGRAKAIELKNNFPICFIVLQSSVEAGCPTINEYFAVFDGV